MGQVFEDQRSPAERAVDIMDERLADFYLEFGLFASGEDGRYRLDDVLHIARNAYWVGVADRSADPEGTRHRAEQIKKLAVQELAEEAEATK